MNNLPIDRRYFREDLYPRDSSEYTPLRHFVQRFREEGRFLTGDVIQECIEDGELRDNGDGCACFRTIRGEGVGFYLIAGFHVEGHRVLITGWPHLHDRRAALKSGYWTEKELERIKNINVRHGSGFEAEYPDYNDWIKSD